MHSQSAYVDNEGCTKRVRKFITLRRRKLLFYALCANSICLFFNIKPICNTFSVIFKNTADTETDVMYCLVLCNVHIIY